MARLAGKKRNGTAKGENPKTVRPDKATPVNKLKKLKKLDVYVFGEGSAGELGLGSIKHDGKKPIDVKRPRLNHLLPAKEVGVVRLAVGGMHCAALTHDNKILTWGVNDQGALGRETPQEGKMKDLSNEGSDTDSDDDGEGLNPSEAEPQEVAAGHFSNGTKFAWLVASDSATFVVTETGLVYGWGTFRGNDGILGFMPRISVQRTPILIPNLKNITTLAAGTNHVLALSDEGKVFLWGANEQNQLARRVSSRSLSCLIPCELELKNIRLKNIDLKNIVNIGCGDYHSFVIDESGNVYSWGLNTFGQTGVPTDENYDNMIKTPTLVKNLKDFNNIKQIVGGGHHTLAVTKTGQVLIWGRIDNAQSGLEVSELDKNHIFFDENEKPRFLMKPEVLPRIDGEFVAASTDGCLVITKKGEAYSWGFSENYQTGQGTTDEIKVATHIDNTAVRDKKLVWCGAGGQFSVLAGEAQPPKNIKP